MDKRLDCLLSKENLTKCVNSLIILLLLLSTCGMLFLGYLAFLDGGKIASFKENAITDKETYVAGDEILVEVSWCKYSDIPTEIIVSFVDTITYTLPPVIRSSGLGCRTEQVKVDIPEHIVPGKYYIHAVALYKVNSFRHVRYTINTNYFEVIHS